MTELILGVVLVAIAMAGLAAGALLGGRCLRRGCASSVGPDGRPRACSTCGRGEGEEKREQEQQEQQEEQEQQEQQEQEQEGEGEGEAKEDPEP